MLFVSNLVLFHNYYFTKALFLYSLGYSHPLSLSFSLICIHYTKLHNHGFTSYNCWNINLSYHCQFTSLFSYSDQNAYVIFVFILLSMFCIASFQIAILWKPKHVLTIIMLPGHSPDITSHVWSHCNGHTSLHKRP